MGLLDVGEWVLAVMAIGSLAGSGIVALMLLRGAPPSLDEGAPDRPHRGPNVSRIPVAGLPGLVFAMAFVWMFWFGVPQFRARSGTADQVADCSCQWRTRSAHPGPELFFQQFSLEGLMDPRSVRHFDRRTRDHVCPVSRMRAFREGL